MSSITCVPGISLAGPEKEQKKPIILNISWKDHEELVNKLATDILQSQWDFDTILCIARGGLLVGLQLSHRLDKKLSIISATSYGGEKEMRQQNLTISSTIAMTHAMGKRVLLIDDLADSGVTLRKVKEHVQEKYRSDVEEIRTAVLWTKTCSKYTPDFTAKVIDAGTWIRLPFEKEIALDN